MLLSSNSNLCNCSDTAKFKQYKNPLSIFWSSKKRIHPTFFSTNKTWCLGKVKILNQINRLHHHNNFVNGIESTKIGYFVFSLSELILLQKVYLKAKMDHNVKAESTNCFWNLTKCLAAKCFCRAFTSAWNPDEAITLLSALHGWENRTI